MFDASVWQIHTLVFINIRLSRVSYPRLSKAALDNYETSFLSKTQIEESDGKFHSCH